MDQDSINYTELNRQWKATCATVFGAEIGELNEYKEWLTELNNPRFVKKSSLSGIETVFTSSEYENDSKFISMDETDFMKQFEPLNINEIKDIDSIVGALQERFYYCGNIVLGNSKFVEKSSNVTDSFFVYDSVKISDCKNIAYSQYLRLCENIFGTNEGGESQSCIRCSILFKNSRSFELWNGTNCSDCYYSFGLDGCRDVMFSFGLIGKNYAIGNLELPKDRYNSIKNRILADMREQLMQKKKLPSLVELTANATIHHEDIAAIIGKPANIEKESKIRQFIDDSFLQTTALIFGKPPEGNMDDYDQWLRSHTIVPYAASSILSKKQVQMSKWPGLAQLPKDRMVTHEEALEIGKKIRISEHETEGISSLSDLPGIIGKIAYYAPEHMVGTNSNLIECQWGSGASNCYRTVICAYSKNCAYSSWPRSSEYCFGCGIVFDSGFSLKCQDSVRLMRCFEVDGGRNNADTWFSHNVEGLEQAMFCFNVKNLHYAIGNAQVGKDNFLKTKKMIQEWALDELEKKKRIDLSIYNIGKKQNAV